ncbi:hypothetical protein EDB85DRAFT_1895942 [Lactarius pseudohatsudake]|nr:hypothetical protein EDB85DRAFT_1895942 [Lactarius pseudohatsudake]
MTSLLSIASRIEAAVATYVSVQDVTDRAEWKHHFDEEKIRKDNSGEVPALHPMLAALYIVLDADGDLAEITRTYPRLNKHRYYQDLLLSEDCWWEILAAKSRNAAAPPNAVTHSLLPGLPRLPRATRNRKKSKTATKAAANSRKCKRASPPGGKTRKRHTGSSWLQPRPAHQDEDEYESEDEEEEEEDEGEYEDVIEIEDEGEDELEDEDEDEIGDGDGDKEKDELEGEDDVDEDEIEERKQYKFEPRPKGTCTRCNAKKLACSLMPKNPKTGKPDRRKLTAKQVFKFRLDQLKGKQPMCKPGEGSDLLSPPSHPLRNRHRFHTRLPLPVPLPLLLSPLFSLPLPLPPPAASIPIPDDTPAITPSLRRCLVPCPPDTVLDVLVRGLSSCSAPSQEQSSAAQASQVPSPGGSGMEALERRVAAIEEWIRAQDKNWKGSL